MKVWITKYALTTGIWVVDAGMSERSADMIFWRPKGGGLLQFAHGKDWWLTEVDAIDRAEAMRQAKIASLNKQIARLEKMTIEIKDLTQ